MSAAPRFLDTHQPSQRLWGLAAATALALHLTALAAMTVTLRGDLDEEGGAPAIELSLEPSAPRDQESPDAPPGPETDESVAATSSVASSEAKETKEEKITQTQAEDAEITREEKTLKPNENERAQRAQQVVSNESQASEATAPPKSEAAAVSERPAAPVHGVDAKANAAVLNWQKQLLAHLNRAKRYPAGGARRAAEVAIFFSIDRRGHVLDYRVQRSSGQTIFDDAALAMMKRADPVPPPPPVIADEGLTFEVPVQFQAGKQ